MGHEAVCTQFPDLVCSTSENGTGLSFSGDI